MKIPTLNLLIVLLLACISCTSDDFTEPEIITTSDLKLSLENNRSTVNCNINLSQIPENSTVKIECLLDLKGKTIQLNSGINFEFDGGDIINGTLKFKGGSIDPKLLNHSLKITGDTQLKNGVLELEPSRWQILEGNVSNSQALQNRLNIEKAIKQTKDLKGNTLQIDNLDAFFNVIQVTHESNPNFYPWIEAINIPSNFNLQMTENTHLRVQPNSRAKYSLLSIYNSSNVTISGGNLYGERDEHTYKGNGSHEWGHVITLHGASDAKVLNVTMKNGSGDGLKIEDDKFSFHAKHRPSKNILVQGCTFDSNRRNNLSITGGQDIIVENNTFLKAGINTAKSQGIAPRFQIDVEPHRKRVNGQIVHYEKVNNVIIRNNKERQSTAGGFLVYTGENVTIENNDMTGGITYSYGVGTIIRNNILTSKKPNQGIGIKGGKGETKTISNNKIHGNTIKGFKIGITISSQDHKVFDNKINNCLTGITGKNIVDSEIYNNTISSTVSNSKGIFLHATTAKNLKIKNNKISTKGNPLVLNSLNQSFKQSNYLIKIINNEFRSQNVVFLFQAYAVNFENNDFTTGVEIRKSANLRFNKNLFDARNLYKHATEWRNYTKNIKLTNNQFYSKKSRRCLSMDSTIPKSVFIERGGNKYKRI